MSSSSTRKPAWVVRFAGPRGTGRFHVQADSVFAASLEAARLLRPGERVTQVTPA